jgi:hypothetical protein
MRALHRLNETATLVWQHCDGRATVASVVGALAHAFGATQAVVEADVRALLHGLEERDLVVPGNDRRSGTRQRPRCVVGVLAPVDADQSAHRVEDPAEDHRADA